MTAVPKNAKRNAEIARLRKAGWAPCDIARLMRLSRQTVGSVCYRAGLSDPKSNPAKGAPSERTRASMSESQRRIWTDPERREKRLAVLRKVAPWQYRRTNRSEAA